MYVPPLTKAILDAGTPTGYTVSQGQRIEDGVLDVLFVDTATNNFFTPWAITYSVGFISQDDGSYHPVGSTQRIPLEMRTGRLRPNFFVGDNWFTGDYAVVWTYVVNNGGPEYTRTTLFTVTTAGIYDRHPRGLGVYDITATLVAQ